MIEELYISKSFDCLGRSLKGCFDCKYCRLIDEWDKNIEYNTIPSSINPLFKPIPVAINLFYGDPLLQVNSTVKYLEQLEKAEHEGPVIIITKGNFLNFPKRDFNLDIHFAFSTFGLEYSNYDGRTHKDFLKNVYSMLNRQNNYKYSIEFRPIVCGVNDSDTSIDFVLSVAADCDLAVGFSGLQGKPDVVKIWEDKGYAFKPYPGYTFGHKKSISEERLDFITNSAKDRGVPIFRKTSCLISHVHNLGRDYNAHYYRPTELGCSECIMRDKCMTEKALRNDLLVKTNMIPFEHKLIKKVNHTCILKQKGICEFPTADCSRISGGLIKIDKKVTTADVRVIKWLTGYTVDADFYESPYLSDDWR